MIPYMPDCCLSLSAAVATGYVDVVQSGKSYEAFNVHNRCALSITTATFLLARQVDCHRYSQTPAWHAHVCRQGAICGVAAGVRAGGRDRGLPEPGVLDCALPAGGPARPALPSSAHAGAPQSSVLSSVMFCTEKCRVISVRTCRHPVTYCCHTPALQHGGAAADGRQSSAGAGPGPGRC